MIAFVCLCACLSYRIWSSGIYHSKPFQISALLLEGVIVYTTSLDQVKLVGVGLVSNPKE